MTIKTASERPADWGIKLKTLQQKIARAPLHPAFHHQYGILMAVVGRFADAASAFDKTLELCPSHGEGWVSKGLIWEMSGDTADAYECFKRAVELTPNYEEALSKLAQLGPQLGHAGLPKTLWHKPSIARRLQRSIFAQSKSSDHTTKDKELDFRDRISADPSDVENLVEFGTWLMKQERRTEAELFFRYALSHNSRHVAATLFLAELLLDVGRREEARSILSGAYDAGRSNGLLAARLLEIELQEARWDRYESLRKHALTSVKKGGSGINPFAVMMFSDDPADHLICAREFAVQVSKGVDPLAPRATANLRDRLHIAYVSADFHDHPVASLVAELFELHDRKRFKIFGYALWLDDGGDLRRRIRSGVDVFRELWGLSDREAAEVIRADEIDILVDLTGYTKNGRPRILAHRPAPVQVNYLGFPGTLGAPFVDYIVVDEIVAPKKAQVHFTEKLVHLPDTYQINDRKRVVARQAGSRLSLGLLDEGTVYCNFNSVSKITPKIFSIWMNILRQVERSVLWLRAEGAAAYNLQKAAEQSGIDPERIVFAQKTESHAEHLARYHHADLFLDTVPYNAHATASEALWAGCPVLTCPGASFHSRVAASIVTASGLQDLVVDDLQAYERRAIAYGQNMPDKTVKQRLRETRASSLLFDTRRTTRHIEAAYAQMWEMNRLGQPPTPSQ